MFHKDKYSILYFFLIYINDLSENLTSNVKLFADDTSIFHVVKDPNTSAEILNHDLTRISEWAYRWKRSFNPDPSMQVQEMLFSNKATKKNYPDIIFNGNTVQKSANQKHLGLILDEKLLTFNDHIKSKLTTVNKLASTLMKLYHYMWITWIESAQYNVALAIAWTIRGTSKEKNYTKNLDLKQWSRKHSFEDTEVFENFE